jgi:glycosyltransferase involved in cell wall biosynthesis
VVRVLFVARYLQMVNHQKVRALAAQGGIDLWHLAPRRWRDSLRLYEQELHEGDGYHFIAARTFPYNDIHRFIYWPPTLFVNTIKPDIIHVEEEPDSLAAVEAVWARQLWASTARLVLFTWQNIRRKRRAAVEQLARYVLQHVDHVIAGNREATDVLYQQGYKGPVTILPQLGVDTETFKPREASTLRHQLGLGRFVVGFAGRFVPAKGLDILIKAAAQLNDSHVLLVGRGPMQTMVESLAYSLGLAGRLTIIGAVPHHQVPLYLNAMDVLVLPSRTTPQWKEQFGHVLIEAMACGTPVIGSDSGAIPEVIDSAGLIFQESDENALADHLRRLAGNPDELRQMSQRGLERVISLYTHEHIAERTMQIYRSML